METLQTLNSSRLPLKRKNKSFRPTGNRRWKISALLAAGVLISYFDRVNLSVAHDALVSNFHISKPVFGFLFSAYNFTYCLCQLPVGMLLDRFGVRLVNRLATLLWSLASFAAAIAWSVPAFFGARFLLGVGESPTFPASAKATGHWFPTSERNLATAFFDSAAKLASAIGVPLIGIFLLHLGWRASFAFTGLLSLAFCVVFSVVYREPGEDPGLSVEEFTYIDNGRLQGPDSRGAYASMTLKMLLCQPKIIGLAIGIFAYNYCFYLLLTWLPIYLSSSLHVDLQKSFLYTGAPWLVATATNLAIGGWGIDWLIGKGFNPGKTRLACLVIGMCFGLGIFGAAPAHTVGTALIWITISLAGLSAQSPAIWSAPALIAPRENVATVGGILNFTGQLAAILAPIVTGYLSFAQAFVVAGVLQIAGILAYLFLLRSVEPMNVQ